MDFSRDFEIGEDGTHFLVYFRLKVEVPAPLKSLGEMDHAEYSRYRQAVLPLLYNHPDYDHSWREAHRGEPFTM